MNPGDVQQARRNGLLKWLLRLGLGLLVLGLIINQRRMAGEISEALRTVSPLVLGGAVLYYWTGQLLSACRWLLLLRARGLAVEFGVCLRLYFAGMFGNLWLPTSIGGDGLRAFLLTKNYSEVGFAEATASIFVERLIGFVALMVLGALGLLYGNLGGSSGWRLLLVGLGLLAVVAVLGLLLSKLTRRSQSRVGGGINKLLSAVGYYAQPGRRVALVQAFAISLVFQASQTVLNIILARVIGLDLPAAVFWWLCPSLALASMLPVGIGGLGVREAAAIGMLSGAGYQATQGSIVAWSLLWQATVWLSSLPGGFFFKYNRNK